MTAYRDPEKFVDRVQSLAGKARIIKIGTVDGDEFEGWEFGEGAQFGIRVGDEVLIAGWRLRELRAIHAAREAFGDEIALGLAEWVARSRPLTIKITNCRFEVPDGRGYVEVPDRRDYVRR